MVAEEQSDYSVDSVELIVCLPIQSRVHTFLPLSWKHIACEHQGNVLGAVQTAEHFPHEEGTQVGLDHGCSESLLWVLLLQDKVDMSLTEHQIP